MLILICKPWNRRHDCISYLPTPAPSPITYDDQGIHGERKAPTPSPYPHERIFKPPFLARNGALPDFDRGMKYLTYYQPTSVHRFEWGVDCTEPLFQTSEVVRCIVLTYTPLNEKIGTKEYEETRVRWQSDELERCEWSSCEWSSCEWSLCEWCSCERFSKLPMSFYLPIDDKTKATVLKTLGKKRYSEPTPSSTSYNTWLHQIRVLIIKAQTNRSTNDKARNKQSKARFPRNATCAYPTPKSCPTKKPRN